MTRIRVTPEELIRAAQQMADISERIRRVASDLGNVLNGLNPNAYDGQLYNKIAGRVSSVQSVAQGPASKIATHAVNLNERAQAFTAADQFRVSRIAGTSAQLRNPTGLRNPLGEWRNWFNFPFARTRDSVKLGNLLGGSDSGATSLPNVIPQNSKPNTTGTQSRSRPVPVRLNPNVDPRNYSPADGCVRYAQDRRPDLGTSPGDGGAANYLEKFRDKIFQITDDDRDLTLRIAPGYAILWPREHPDLGQSAGAHYGHIAIVEEVGLDYIIVSQAGWRNETRKKISKNQLKSLYVIP